MGFYANTIVPRLVTCACGTKPILKQREKVVPEARGQVLEIGMGAGHNLPYYQRDQVERVVGIDPCSTSWGLAQPRAKKLGVPIEFIEGSAESMPLPDAAFDTVLMTYSLCTIPDAQAALQEMRRVLKPGWPAGFLRARRGPRCHRREVAAESQPCLAETVGWLQSQPTDHAVDY